MSLLNGKAGRLFREREVVQMDGRVPSKTAQFLELPLPDRKGSWDLPKSKQNIKSMR